MSERAPLVSVIVTTFNHERYVEAAIRSILDQTFRDLELVVVDDGSTDGTRAKIERFADPRVVRIYQENQGPSAAFNRGIAACRGKYLAFMAGDDVSHLDRIERQLEAYVRNGPGVLFSEVDFIDEEGAPLSGPHFATSIFENHSQSRADILRQFIRHGNFINAGTCFAETSLFRASGPFDPLLLQLQDFDMWIRMVKHYDFHFLREKTMSYRIRRDNQNLSAPTTCRQIRSSNECFIIMQRFFDDMSPELFREVFHDDLIRPDCRSPIDIACEQAFLCVRSPFPMHKLIGVEKFYVLLGNPESAAVLRSRYQFDTHAFMRLLQETDSFNACPDCRSSLYFEAEAGSNKTEAVHAIVEPFVKQFTVTFTLEGERAVRNVHWHPFENLAGLVRIEKGTWRNSAGQSGEIDLAGVRSNGAQMDDGTHCFESGAARFLIPFAGALSSLTIDGWWQPEALAVSAARLREQRDMLAGQRDVIQGQRDARQAELDAVLNSQRWKLACKVRSICRFLASPAKLLSFAAPSRRRG